MLRAILAAWILASGAVAAQKVEGVVVNAVTGAGIAGVRVRVFPVDGGPADGRSTGTDAEGHFRIEGLKDGAYRAIYDVSGFKRIPAPGNAPPPFAVVSGGPPVRLEIKMQPLGTISGRVMDGNGRPVPGAAVRLVRGEMVCAVPVCFAPSQVAKTSAHGEYTFKGLEPGAWLVSAVAPATWAPPEARGQERLGWAETFYPGVADPRLEQTVNVQAGAEQWGIDIKLAAAPVHQIRGRVLGPDGAPLAKVTVALRKGFGSVLTQDTKADGSFEFASVMDDEWDLWAFGERSGVKLKGAQTVEIKGRDLENFEVRLNAPFALRGKLIMEVPEGVPAPEAPPIDMLLVSNIPATTGGADATIVRHSDDGSLTARNVYPGTYEVEQISDPPAPYYLDSIRLGDHDALGLVSILSDAEPLTITYKLGGGTVRGTMENCAGPLLLIPVERVLRRRGFWRVTECRENGRFEFAAVRPGEYYAFAIASDDPGSFAAVMKDDRLLGQASKVTVRANESTAVEIRPLPR